MTRCPRCKRELLDPAALAAAADKVRAVVAGAVSLVQGGAELEKAYGGDAGLRRALAGQLDKAEALSLELSRSTACLAGGCIIPPANERVGPRCSRCLHAAAQHASADQGAPCLVPGCTECGEGYCPEAM